MGVGSEIGVSLASTGMNDIKSDLVLHADLSSRQKCGLSRFLSTLCKSHRFKNLQVF